MPGGRLPGTYRLPQARLLTRPRGLAGEPGPLPHAYRRRCDRQTRNSAEATAAPRTTQGQVSEIASLMWPSAIGSPQRPSVRPHSQTQPGRDGQAGQHEDRPLRLGVG